MWVVVNAAADDDDDGDDATGLVLTAVTTNAIANVLERPLVVHVLRVEAVSSRHQHNTTAAAAADVATTRAARP